MENPALLMLFMTCGGIGATRLTPETMQNI